MTDLTDKRELILARLVEALEGVEPAFKKVFRNKDEISDSSKPAVDVLDGTEAVEEDPGARDHRPSNAPTIVTMRPDIIFLTDTENPDDIGTILNAARAAILKAVVLDAQLLALVGTNGKIKYESFEPMLAVGRRIEGQFLLKIAFLYPLKYADL